MQATAVALDGPGTVPLAGTAVLRERVGTDLLRLSLQRDRVLFLRHPARRIPSSGTGHAARTTTSRLTGPSRGTAQ